MHRINLADRNIAIGLCALTTSLSASAMTSAPFDVGSLVLGALLWLIVWIAFAALSISQRTAPFVLAFVGVTLVPFILAGIAFVSGKYAQAKANADSRPLLAAYGEFCKPGTAPVGRRSTGALTTTPARPTSLLIADLPPKDQRSALLNWRSTLAALDDTSCRNISITEVQSFASEAAEGQMSTAHVLKRASTCPTRPVSDARGGLDAEFELNIDGPIRTAVGPAAPGASHPTFEEFTLYVTDRRSGQRLAEERVFHSTGVRVAGMEAMCPQIEERLPALLQTAFPK